MFLVIKFKSLIIKRIRNRFSQPFYAHTCLEMVFRIYVYGLLLSVSHSSLLDFSPFNN